MTARTCLLPVGGSLEGMLQAVRDSRIPITRWSPVTAHGATLRAPCQQEFLHWTTSAVLAAFVSIFLLAGELSAATPQGIPDWNVESDQAGSLFGIVASAGDVNGDGYQDVVVGAATFQNGESNEGAAFLFLGSASGLMTTPSWTAEGNQAEARFGYPVAGAGDVNGDGYDDVIVGAQLYDNGEMDEGRAFLFMGSSTGLSSSSAWVTEGDQAGAWYGHWVASAGDVNGDSYGDVIVGAPYYANGETAEGRAYVYLGSPTGLATVPVWTAESDQANAWFGECVACAGDVDDDGFSEIIVGSSFFDSGESNEGRSFLYMGSPSGPGTLASWTAESNVADANYGRSVASAGDVNADGFGDVVVGAVNFANGQTNEGRAFLYLGSALGLATSPAWGFESDQAGAGLGHAVAGAGDVNGDGYDDVVAGAFQFDDGENDEGRAFLFLGTPAGLTPSPTQVLESNNVNAWFGLYFGAGDVNKDGYSDLVVGARSYSNGETDEGAAFLYLGEPSFGDVLYETRIADGEGGIPAMTFDALDWFGGSMANIGDLDADGIDDMAAGAPYDDTAGTNAGAVYVLFMKRDGSVRSFQKITEGVGNFPGTLPDSGVFGTAVASPGDLDGDGKPDLAVGAPDDPGGGTLRGAVWILLLNADGTVKTSPAAVRITQDSGGFAGSLQNGNEFGVSLAGLGTFDGDNVADLAVGAYGDNDGGSRRGAVWILFLNANGTVKAHQKISDTVGGFGGTLQDNWELGRALATVGDLNADGVVDLAVGSSQDSQVESVGGAVWIMLMNPNSSGTVSSFTKITEGIGGFSGDLDPDDHFGISVADLVDVGGPGIRDIAVGASYDDDGDTNAGAVWILSLDSGGNVVGQLKISDTSGGFGEDLMASDFFGSSVAGLGDLDRDGRRDLAIGASQNVVWNCFLNDGTLKIGANATTWDGSTDMDWTEPTNWSNGTPDQSKTAIIPDATTTPNDPSVTATGQQCNSLWIQSGGTLDIAASAGADGLGVFAGATVMGPITGTGGMVFEAEGMLAGNDTIGLTADPAVRSDADLEVQGGPLAVTGSFEALADVSVAALADLDVGGVLAVAGSLALDGALGIGDSVEVGNLLSSSSSGSLETRGSGTCITAGQLCFHGDVTTACTISVERSTTDATSFEADSGWPGGVSIDVPGTVTLLTADLSIGGDLVLEEGTFAVGVGGTIDADGSNGIVVKDGATLDITGFQTLVPAPTPITVQSGGKLNIGPGGELLLESNTLTIESGGLLCLNGSPASTAALSGYQSSRYTLSLSSGARLAAKNFVLRQMSSSGIVIGPGVTLEPAPLDLRSGVFDLPAPGGVLLDIQRSAPTQLRYLIFDNSLSASGAKNVRTLAGSVITLVNWTGDLASDATTAEAFDDDPGEPTQERVVWAPPEHTSATFSAAWGSDHVKLKWNSTAEVDCETYVLKRSPEPPGTYVTIVEVPPTGPGNYSYRDFAVQAQTGYRYRLFERLTHGSLRLLDEEVLPSSSAPTVLLPVWGRPSPPVPPLAPLVVGPGGPYPDVGTALHELARRGQRDPVTLDLVSGRHEPFEIGPGLAFDLCIVARRGTVIGAGLEPVRIEGLPAQRSVELVGLAIDARRAHHPSLVVEDTEGVVLLQDVDLRGNGSGPRLQLSHARAVALQGGAIEGELLLERGSRATASGVKLSSFELTGNSVLETRDDRSGQKTKGIGGTEPGRSPVVPGKVEPGSRRLAHEPAPRLTLEGGRATLDSCGPGFAWLGVSERLGFQTRARLLEGVLLLEPSNHASVGSLRPLAGGRASWQLAALPSGGCLHLQGLVFDPITGRICLTDVVRVER